MPLSLSSLSVISLLMSGGGLALAVYFGSLALLRRTWDHGLLAILLVIAAFRAVLPIVSVLLMGTAPAGEAARDALLLRVDSVSLLIICMLYMAFLRVLFLDDVPRWILSASVVLCGMVAFLGLTLNAAVLPVLRELSVVLMMGLLTCVGAISIRLLRRCRAGAGWIALSVLVLVSTVLIDLLLIDSGDAGVPGIVSAGCVLFALGHVVLMGARLNRGVLASEMVSRHVVALNRTLEQQVSEASRQMDATREQLHAILACIPDGILTVGEDGRIDSFGPGAERVFGWSGQDVMDQPVVNLLSPEWASRMVRSLRRYEEEGILTYSGQGEVEMEGRRRDGSLFPMMTTLSKIDVEGQTVFVAAVRDVSRERSRQDQLLRQGEEMRRLQADLALIEDRAAVGHYISTWVDGEWQTRCSPGLVALWGYDGAAAPPSLAGLLAGVHPDDQIGVFARLDRQDWSSTSCTVRVSAVAGEERVVELSVLRDRDGTGAVTREIGIARLASVSLQDVSPGDGGDGEGLMGSAMMTTGRRQDEEVLVVRNILLVEDVEVNRRVAVAFLEREGYTIDVASNGVEAIEMATRGTYDLILMDIRLPDLDGVEATRRIRALPDPARASVPVLALTANVFGDDVRRYEEAGMSGVVAKPIRMPQFRAVLNAMLRKRPQTPEGANDTWADDVWINDVWDAAKSVLDEGFIRERRAALGAESFAVILDLGRRSAGFAVEEVDRCARETSPNGDDLGKAAHKLAGAASNFGFAALFALGRRVEALCERGQVEEAATLAAQVLSLHRQTDSALEQWLEQGGGR